MRKILILITMLTLVSAGLYAQNVAAATVRLTKTEPISATELLRNISEAEAQYGRALSQDERKQILDDMIDITLLIQEAESDRNLSISEEEISQGAMTLMSQQLQYAGQIPAGMQIDDRSIYLQIATQAGVNVNEFELMVKNQMLVEKLLMAREAEALQNIPSATEEELSNQYQIQIQRFVMADSVHFNHIFFTTQGLSPEMARAKSVKAREVYNKLMNTQATFPELVASESEDEQSKANGGLTGPIMKADSMATQLFGTDFINEVFSMNVGDVSEPLQSLSGYHIVQITRKDSARLLPQDDIEVRQHLLNTVRAIKFQEAFDQARVRVTDDLKGRATVRYIGEYANW